jgi:hypothetical protein
VILIRVFAYLLFLVFWSFVVLVGLSTLTRVLGAQL